MDTHNELPTLPHGNGSGNGRIQGTGAGTGSDDAVRRFRFEIRGGGHFSCLGLGCSAWLVLLGLLFTTWLLMG